MKWKWLTLAIAGISAVVFGGFPATESYLPAVGRLAGEGGAQFYTTMWATNLTGAPVSFTFEFLKEGQANPSPASFTDTLSPGQTKMYENVVESRLGLSDALGAARIRASGEMLVAERIYDQAPGDDLGNTQGLFFAGVPKSFSISLGQSASIQGVSQGGSENFRYNFALVETGGGSPTVNVQLFDGNGTFRGQKAYAMQPYEQLQPNVKDLDASVSTINARITATVTGGTGSVLLAGAQVANESQDSSGFEMSFRDDLLGGGSSGGGLTSVVHDGTLLGSGTGTSPLSVNPASVVTSVNALTGALTLAAGSNVTIGKSGSTLTINAATGSGGGTTELTLPYAGTISTSGVAFGIENTGTGIGIIAVAHGAGAGLYGGSSSGAGIQGTSFSGAGVSGESSQNDGVYGKTLTNSFSGVYGITDYSGYGVFGEADGVNKGFGVGGNAANGGLAAHFYTGNVRIESDLHVVGKIFAGTKDFEIDHPLDPANKYLVHASIESSEMLNVYSGNAMLDGHGVATVQLPAWMEAENRDFRYQLTAVGSPQPGLYVVQKVRNDRFVIAGGAPGAEVSWQLTGVRKDPWAIAHPLVAEQDKLERERGFYLHPEVYGLPATRQMNWADEPEQMKKIEARRKSPSAANH